MPLSTPACRRIRRDCIQQTLFMVGFLTSLLNGVNMEAQVVDPFYSSIYTIRDVGSVPGVPERYGALAFKAGQTNVLLIGGDGNSADAKIYQVTVVRGADNHITGFSGTAAYFADAAGAEGGGGIDGGLAYGPNNVLFFTSYPDNTLNQIKSGQTTVAKRIDLEPYTSAVGSVMFVPAGMPGAGRMKLLDFGADSWFDATLQADPVTSGTYRIATISSGLQMSGGIEGAFYVAAGNPKFAADSVLICEYSLGSVASYTINANGDPIVSTRKSFLTGIDGAEGATRDPATGDFVFGTFASPGKIYVVRGFGIVGTLEVSITSPTNSQRFAATADVWVEATATQSNGAINRVDFYLDGALVGTDTSDPFAYLAPGLIAGSHQWFAVATGNGVSGTSAIVSITITNVLNQAPVVVWSAPANGSVLPDCSVTTLAADAFDPDGSVSLVRFYNHGTNLLGTDASQPYSLALTNFGAATNVLTAVAVDNAGLSSTSAAAIVRVTLIRTNSMAILQAGPSTVLLCCRGEVGTNYVVESVTNLATSGANDWKPVRTNTAPAASYGSYAFPEDTAGGLRRFYRMRRQ